VIRKWLKMWKIKKICKANRYYCPACLYGKPVVDKDLLCVAYGCELMEANDGKA